mgnify:CR=1 FL=1
MKSSIIIKKIAKDLELEVLAGETGLNRTVSAEMLNRPGVELAGFYDFYDQERILLIGSKEASFLKLFSPHIQKERVNRIVQEQPPAIVFSHNVEVPQDFIDAGNSNSRMIPVATPMAKLIPQWSCATHEYSWSISRYTWTRNFNYWSFWDW